MKSHYSPPSAASSGRSDTAACQSGVGAFTVSDQIRWVDAKPELRAPPVPFPSRRIFETTGEEMLRALVHHHHQRLSQSTLQHLFPTNEREFIAGVTRAADYVIETCGGPDYFTSHHGKPCMRKRHYPFSIDEEARDIWLRLLCQAFDDVGFPAEVRQEYWDWAEAFSIRMINHRNVRIPLRRHPFPDLHKRHWGNTERAVPNRYSGPKHAS